MNLREARMALLALPGVYQVDFSVVQRDNLFAMPEAVHFHIRCASPDLLEARLGIMEIREDLERDQECMVFLTMGAGLRRPEGAASG